MLAYLLRPTIQKGVQALQQGIVESVIGYDKSFYKIATGGDREIDRLFDIWRDLRAASRSTEFLCGDFGIVDAVFTPVVFRFCRFGIDIPTDSQSYIDAVLNYSPVQEWLALAEKELRAG